MTGIDGKGRPARFAGQPETHHRSFGHRGTADAARWRRGRGHDRLWVGRAKAQAGPDSSRIFRTNPERFILSGRTPEIKKSIIDFVAELFGCVARETTAFRLLLERRELAAMQLGFTGPGRGPAAAVPGWVRVREKLEKHRADAGYRLTRAQCPETDVRRRGLRCHHQGRLLQRH